MADFGVVYSVCDGDNYEAIKCGYTKQDACSYIQGFSRTYRDTHVLQLMSTPFPKLAESYLFATLDPFRLSHHELFACSPEQIKIAFDVTKVAMQFVSRFDASLPSPQILDVTETWALRVLQGRRPRRGQREIQLQAIEKKCKKVWLKVCREVKVAHTQKITEANKRDVADVFSQFLADCCEKNSNAKVFTHVLLANLETVCKTKHLLINRYILSDLMRNEGFEKKVVRIGTETHMGYIGVTLKETAATTT